MEKCSDYGGISRRTGDPCLRRVKGGPCPAHSEEGQEETAQAKLAFLGLYEDGSNSIEAAANQAGFSRVTLWRLRQEDPEFDAAVLAKQAVSDAIRLAMVEDSMFARIVRGEASGAETIFWLVNRSDGRWKDLRYVKHSGQILHGLLGMVAAMPAEEVDELMSLSKDERRARLVGMAENGSNGSR